MSLTTAELKSLVPAAFATEPAAHCSPRYVMFPTMQAVSLLQQEGFVPVEARQDRSRSYESDPLHARHMIRFRAPGTMDRKTSRVGELSLDVILQNSSDAGSPFRLDLGVYRKICSNGMVTRVVGDSVHQAHEHVTAASVIERARILSAQSAPLFAKIARWSALSLSEPRTAEFAARAAALRWGEKAALYDPVGLLAVQRDEDRGSDLWTVFNRLQENGVRGGVSGRGASGRALTSRALTGIDGEMTFNTQLWELAEEFAAAAETK